MQLVLLNKGRLRLKSGGVIFPYYIGLVYKNKPRSFYILIEDSFQNPPGMSLLKISIKKKIYIYVKHIEKSMFLFSELRE